MCSHRLCLLSAGMVDQRRPGQEGGKEQPLGCGEAGSDSRGTGRAPGLASLVTAGCRGGKARLWSGNGKMSGMVTEAEWMGARQPRVKTVAPSLTSWLCGLRQVTSTPSFLVGTESNHTHQNSCRAGVLPWKEAPLRNRQNPLLPSRCFRQKSEHVPGRLPSLHLRLAKVCLLSLLQTQPLIALPTAMPLIRAPHTHAWGIASSLSSHLCFPSCSDPFPAPCAQIWSHSSLRLLWLGLVLPGSRPAFGPGPPGPSTFSPFLSHPVPSSSF